MSMSSFFKLDIYHDFQAGGFSFSYETVKYCCCFSSFFIQDQHYQLVAIKIWKPAKLSLGKNLKVSF